MFININYCNLFMGELRLILKIKKNKSNGQKYINIPKNEDIFENEYVCITKLNKNE